MSSASSRPIPNGNTVKRFGAKHYDRTYSEIATLDRRYVDWALKQNGAGELEGMRLYFHSLNLPALTKPAKRLSKEIMYPPKRARHYSSSDDDSLFDQFGIGCCCCPSCCERPAADE